MNKLHRRQRAGQNGPPFLFVRHRTNFCTAAARRTGPTGKTPLSTKRNDGASNQTESKTDLKSVTPEESGVETRKLNLTVILMAAALAMACSLLDSGSQAPNQLNPTPYNPGSPLDIEEVWEESQPQRGQISGDRYKNRWVIIKVSSVNTGTSDGVLIKRMPSPPNTIEFKYNYTEHADDARDERNFIIMCNVGGVSGSGAKLVMHYCRPTDSDGKSIGSPSNTIPENETGT